MFLLSNSTFNYMDGYEVHHRVWQGYSGPQSMDVPCNKNTTKLPQRELQPWQCDSDVPCTIYKANIETAPDMFENAALFFRLGPPSTQIRQEHGTLFKPEEFENLVWTRNTENGAYIKTNASR